MQNGGPITLMPHNTKRVIDCSGGLKGDGGLRASVFTFHPSGELVATGADDANIAVLEKVPPQQNSTPGLGSTLGVERVSASPGLAFSSTGKVTHAFAALKLEDG